MHDLTKQAPPEARNSSKPKRLQHLQRRRRPAGLNDDDAEVQCEALRLLRLLLRRQPLLLLLLLLMSWVRALLQVPFTGTRGRLRDSWGRSEVLGALQGNH